MRGPWWRSEPSKLRSLEEFWTSHGGKYKPSLCGIDRAASGLRAALVMAPEQAARAEAQGVRRVGELVGALRAAAADSRRSLAAAWRRDPSVLQRELSAWVRSAPLFLETKTRGAPSACLLPPILHAGGECCLLSARVLMPVCAQ